MLQIIQTIFNDNKFSVYTHDSEVMGRIYEICANKLISEAKWSQAVPVLQQSMDYWLLVSSFKAKTLLKYQLLCSMIAGIDVKIFLASLADSFKCDPEISNLISFYQAF